MSEPTDDAFDSFELDGVAELSLLIDVPEDMLRAAIGSDLGPGEAGPGFGSDVTIFTGLTNPRTPGRPLVAIRVELEDTVFEVGHAVGVPLPNGRTQWSLGDPRTVLPYGEVPTRDAFDLSDVMERIEVQRVLVDALRDAIARIADVAMLRGTRW